MGRLRQFNPNNYGSASAIHAEFESIIRYIVAGERGSRSYGEMFQDLFDENGDLNLGVDFKFDAGGLSMKVGEAEWEVLATVDDLRGYPGRDVGTVPLPVITGLTNFTATSGQTVFNYVHTSTDTIFVHQNGLLLEPTVDYTTNSTADTVTLVTGATLADVITIYKIRGDAGIVVARTDTTVTAASQSVFGVTFPANSYQEMVYLNGLLLASGTDYVLSSATSSLTLLDAAITNDVLTVAFLSSSGATEIPGFLVEGVYTDLTTGLIPFNKIAVAAGEIAQSKVNGLTTFISTASKITVGSSTPVDPVSGNFWLDTSSTPSKLKVYDASSWLDVQPQNALPTIRTTDAGYAVFINSTGTGYTYLPIDFSSLILNAEKGVAGGVATLDGDGRLDPTQYPLVRTTDTVDIKLSGSVTNATYTMRRLFGERFRIVGLTVKTTSGSCTIQLAVSGTAVGSTYSAAATVNDQTFGTVIEVDATVLSKTLDVIVTAASSANDLYLTAVIERLN